MTTPLPLPLLFLDIDGVLNAHEYDPAVRCGQIHRDKVERLNRVLRATGARFVLSSAWRYIVHRGEATLAGMDWLLRSHGLLGDRLIGITRPDTMRTDANYQGHPQSWPVCNERGQQITDWLTGHAGHIWPRYVVIDDLDLGIVAAGHPFVHTVGTVGLTDIDADRAIAILSAQGVTTDARERVA